MSNSPSDRCGYTCPEDYEINDHTRQQSCCLRETVNDEHDRCLWHVDPNGVEKSARELRIVRASPETRRQNTPFPELLDGANLSGVELRDEISFENVALRESDLSGADLRGAVLSSADLRGADFLARTSGLPTSPVRTSEVQKWKLFL